MKMAQVTVSLKCVISRVFALLLPGLWIAYLLLNSMSEKQDDIHTDPQHEFNSVLPYCSQELFRRYYVIHSTFPRGGIWNDSGIPHFEPYICQYKWTRIPPEELEHCVTRLNLEYIVTIGDSNGHYYFEAMLEYFNHTSSHCILQKLEEHNVTVRDNVKWLTPDRKYYSKGNTTIEKSLMTEDRGCHTCLSQQWRCTDPNTMRTVNLENFGNTRIVGQSLYIKNKNMIEMSNYEEFLLRYYFQDKSPDLIIVFVPLNHMKGVNSVEFQRNLTLFTKYCDKYIPKSKVYVITGTAEFDSLRLNFSDALYHGQRASDTIAQLNYKLFDAFSHKMMEVSPQFFGFFNLHDLSNSRYYWRTLDGVHFHPVWYEAIMSNILEVMCSESGSESSM